jgi:uncharacterized membrane protein
MGEEIINIIHLLATATWLGGAIFMKVVLEPSAKKIDPREAGKLMGIVAPRFSAVAWLSIILLVVTGILKTPSGMLLDTSSTAGIILTVKHVFVFGVILIGLAIVLVPVRAMKRYAPAPGTPPSEEFRRAQQLLHYLSMSSTILGVLIVGLAAFLW